MSNIVNLNIFYDSNGILQGNNSVNLVNSDLSGIKKITRSIYDVSVSPPVVVHSMTNSETIFLTKIQDFDGSYFLVTDSYSSVTDQIIAICKACEQPTPFGGGKSNETLVYVDFPIETATVNTVTDGYEYLILNDNFLTIANVLMGTSPNTLSSNFNYQIMSNNDVKIFSNVPITGEIVRIIGSKEII